MLLQRYLLVVSIVGFTVASMLCGMAQSVTQIILFRVLQGAFGAALVPLSQTVLLGAYPRERQGFAMAFFGMGVMVGPVLGPVLGRLAHPLQPPHLQELMGYPVVTAGLVMGPRGLGTMASMLIVGRLVGGMRTGAKVMAWKIQ